MYPERIQRAPGGGTAITAGILGLLGGLAGLIGLGFVVVELIGDGMDRMTRYWPDWYGPFLIGQQVVAGVTTVLLLVGSVMLLCRSSAGRVMVVVGAALVLLSYAVRVLVFALDGGSGRWLFTYDDRGYGGPYLSIGGYSEFSIALLLFPLLTLIFAAVSATGRWCRYRPVSAGAPYVTGAPPVIVGPYSTGALPVVAPHSTGPRFVAGAPRSTGPVSVSGAHPVPEVVSVDGVAYVRADSLVAPAGTSAEGESVDAPGDTRAEAPTVSASATAPGDTSADGASVGAGETEVVSIRKVATSGVDGAEPASDGATVVIDKARSESGEHSAPAGRVTGGAETIVAGPAGVGPGVGGAPASPPAQPAPPRTTAPGPIPGMVSGAHPVAPPGQFVPPDSRSGAYPTVSGYAPRVHHPAPPREPVRIPLWRRVVDGVAVVLGGVALLLEWNSALSLFGGDAWLLWRLLLLPVSVLAVGAVTVPYLAWLGAAVVPRWVSVVLVAPYSLLIGGIVLADWVTGLRALGESGSWRSGVGAAVLPAVAVVGVVVARVLDGRDVMVARTLLWVGAVGAVLSGLVGIGVIATVFADSSAVWSPVARGLALLVHSTVFAAAAAMLAVGLSLARPLWQLALTGLGVTALSGALLAGITDALPEWFGTPLYTGLVFVVAAAAVLIERIPEPARADARTWITAARIWLGLAAGWLAGDAVVWGLTLTAYPGTDEGTAILSIAIELFTAAGLFAAVFTLGPTRAGAHPNRVPALAIGGAGLFLLFVATAVRLAGHDSDFQVDRTAFTLLLPLALAALVLPRPVRAVFGAAWQAPATAPGPHP